MPRLRSIALVLLFAFPAVAQTPPEYTPVVKQLSALIDQQVKDKNLPALSIALVDDQKLVWS
ncbi:MAG: hypothetical protein ABGY75_11760, partial [Gemmataceae bacterium]